MSTRILSWPHSSALPQGVAPTIAHGASASEIALRSVKIFAGALAGGIIAASSAVLLFIFFVPTIPVLFLAAAILALTPSTQIITCVPARARSN